MAELGQGLIDEEAKSTGVQVEMLDYDYVEKCNDVKELKAILSVLQSGKEGHYPHVSKCIFCISLDLYRVDVAYSNRGRQTDEPPASER